MKTVFVLSDDEDERDLLSTALGRDGRWEVTVPPPGVVWQWLASPDDNDGNGQASAGQDGAADVPDVAVVDLEMQGALPMAELARLKWPGCAIVWRSGRAPDEISLAGRISGAVGFLHEDLDALVLSEELERLLALVGLAEMAMDGAGASSPHIVGVRAGEIASAVEALRRRLAAHPRSAGEARRAVKASLSAWSLDGFSDDAALLVTELVSNAVSHAGTEVEVSVVLRSDAVRVEVADFSALGRVEAVPSPDDAERGRGLAIVESLATRWGVTTRASGKTVWFELDRIHGTSLS